MTWNSFIETTLQWHKTTFLVHHQSISTQQVEVGSSRNLVEVPKAPRLEVTRMYQRGKGLVFTSQVENRDKPST